MHIVCHACQATNRVPAERTREDPVCGRCGQALLPAAPVTLTDATFDRVVGGTELPVLVDFWAGWCGPCRMMAPHLEQAAERLRGRVIVAKVDSDANPQTSSRHAIRSLPTLVLFERGAERKRQAGAIQAAQIVSWAGGAG